MNIFDIVLSVIVLLGLARGFQKGLIKSVIGLVGWLVALVLASKMANPAGRLFSDMIDSPELQVATGFLMVVLVTITVLHLVGLIAEKLLTELNLTIVDRFAGGVLGAAKGILVVLVLISLTAPVFKKMTFWKDSIFVPQLLPLAPIAMQFSKDIVNNTMTEVIPKELKKEKTKKQTSELANNEVVDNEEFSNEEVIDEKMIDEKVIDDETNKVNDD